MDIKEIILLVFGFLQHKNYPCITPIFDHVACKHFLAKQKISNVAKFGYFTFQFDFKAFVC